MRLKRTTKRPQTKIQRKLARKSCRSLKVILWPSRLAPQLRHLQTPIMYYGPFFNETRLQAEKRKKGQK